MRNERVTQDRVVDLLRSQLGYSYLGNLEDRDNSNIRQADLETFLRKNGEYSDVTIGKALYELQKSATINPNEDLYPVNKAVYSLLRYGIAVKESVGEFDQTVRLIDWNNPEQNEFSFAEEVTVAGVNTKRPDIVIYVNGIALGVLELKRASVLVSEGIRQNLDNQEHRFIKPFFTTIQVVLAGNDAQGLYYGTTKTSEKYFLKWKEDGYSYDPDRSLLDQQLLQFCDKRRLLEIIHDFVVFDAGIKKLCRPNQYFGVKKAQESVAKRQGGIIWHTQGSGKSLTMVWFAKWIREHHRDARLLIITDRTELDDQIEKVFSGVDEKIYRTKSGQDLINRLNDTTPWLICSLIHKFGRNDELDIDEYVEQLHKPKDFAPKGNLFVFIDECHRTQSGALHEAMKDLLPDALFIGFTGTPLLKADKRKSIEIFGKYIHTYKFDEAVQDGVVLDLLYEARDVDQHANDQKGIDEWFEVVTKGMNDLPKAELKQKWGTMQKILSTKERLQKIAFDIIKDFKIKPRLRNGRGNAMLVSGSIFEACRYFEIFQNFGFKNCAIVTSYEPTTTSIKGETTGEGDTEKIEQYEIYQRMLNGKDRETFERDVKKQFIDEPANMQLLIVVDKLLTGFDAPSCTYLYIDKQMRDHGLFQAICRVNRTENEDKEFGYIVDYKDLFENVHGAIDDYTSDAFDKFEEEDVKGLLLNRLLVAKERMEDSLEVLHQLCAPVEPPKQIEQYIRYFCGNPDDKQALKDTEETRLTFYKAVVSAIRAYNNIAPEMSDAGFSDAEAARIKHQVDEYAELRNAIKAASGDYIDLKKYEPEMRQLLDMYLSADPSRTLSDFGDATLLQLIVEKGIKSASEKLPKVIRQSKEAVAETLEANMRKVITQEMPINPVYYEKMSTLLEELIRRRKESALEYEQFLKEIEAIARDLNPGKGNHNYPKDIDTAAKMSLYDNLDKQSALVLALDAEILQTKKDDWIGNTLKEREVKGVIRRYVNDEAKADAIFEIIKSQREYM
ncbi:MAG: HsdR family type I site-specific deoxyribonuclease [Bacteroidetes bacterium]|nr:HsdR family type I site-specific deoxyribonuclease [Bacteroidota bacterium]